MNQLALRDIFGKFLEENGEKYKDIVVLDTDLSTSTRTNLFAKNFPNRFFNMGIAEQNVIGVAIGFAISNKIPVVSGFSIFITGRGWEFIRLACHDNLNIKIIVTHGGLVGEDGSTHNALEDISLMATLPNLTVLVPLDKIELIQMLEYAFDTKGPFYIRLPRNSYSLIHDKLYKFSIGSPDIIKEGTDICLIGTGYGCNLAQEFASEYEDQLNISIKIINLSSIKPININQLLKEIKNLKGIIIIEEHNIYCGLGSILARIISDKYPIPMKFIGINDAFGESGERRILLETYGLNFKNIYDKIIEILKI